MASPPAGIAEFAPSLRYSFARDGQSTAQKGVVVASSLLFDISQIDLAAVAVDADEVGQLNPQCGDMRHLDHVVWLNHDRTSGLGVKNVRDDEFWVAGHVPGRPLLPGVLMIEAGAQLCSIIHKKRTGSRTFMGFIRCDQVAFRHQVIPGDQLYLLGKEVSANHRKFVSKVQGVVKSKLVFEAEITGMVL